MPIRLIFIFTILCVDLFSQPQAKISIITDRSDALIYINNIPIGRGRIDTIIAFGRHELKLRRENGRWGSQTFADTIDLGGDRDQYIFEYAFRDEISVDSDPQDVSIYAGDSLVGITPAIIPFAGDPLKLFKKNYETKMFVPSDTRDGKIKLDFTGNTDDFNFTESVWFKVLIGSAVALGATAAYYKIQADNKYEEYESSGDEALLNTTERYDLYSGIALGALQINFGILIYFFLTD